MLITESQLGFSARRFDSLGLLDNMSYLSEAESVFSPALVPVVENTQVGAHLIRLEDMIAFGESNGIEDLGYALQCVCESSEIDPSTVAFTVNEENVIADESIADLVRGIMNEGVTVIAKPLNENNPMGILAELAVNYLAETGDSYLLECLCDDPVSLAIGWFGEGVESKKQDKSLAAQMAAGREQAARKAAAADEQKARDDAAAKRRAEVAARRAAIEARKQNDPDFADKAAGYAVQNARANAEYNEQQDKAKKDAQKGWSAGAGTLTSPGQAESFLDKVKKYGNKGRDAIAAIIAKLHKMAEDCNKTIQDVKPEERSVWQKIKQKIAAAIQYLSAKLHNAIASSNRADLAAK